MPKIKLLELFDHAALELGMYKLNASLLQRDTEALTDDTLKELANFINACKVKRGAEPVNFQELNLVCSWGKWNSGGGCMIYSLETTNSRGETLSLHVGADSWCLCDIESGPYWELESWEEQCKHHLVQSELTERDSIAFLLCPEVGQATADLLAIDIEAILKD